ncbi:uncharacterized protein LY79DRAFT_152165 [Colletotrichum navitas]|uniref:Uncharacterized protein n=1 Tax=Colletotrichum navitas TaxID=681940 RepID=A0AAD8VCR3_9PEZI|nr:uncharacterized protein LY79DRAFT_152165 [Colletotrichum navitas]KAK1599810.1 hypothetical protein LY79DRAFT_152165 [Colletotrichum navitas]
MTKSPRGPSLPQARSYHHNHYHLHNKRAATPENAHHQHRQLDVAAPAPTDAQPSTTQGPKIVVETVSVIEIVDASGHPVEVQTLLPTSVTVDAIRAALNPASAVLSPSSTGDSASQSPSISSDATLSAPAATTPSSTSSSASQGTSLTSDPLSTTPAPSAAASSLYSSLSGRSNSTISFLTSTNSSSTSVSTTTTLSSHLSSGTTSVTSSILSSLSSTWGSGSDSTWLSSGLSTTSTLATSASSTLDATATGTGAAGIIGGGEADQPTSPPTSSGDSGSDNETVPTATVVGSVVGSVAGAAFLLVLVFLALRWKKSTGGRLRLSETSMGKRGILTGSGGPEGGGGGGGGMIQRSLSYGRSAAAVGFGAAAAARKHSRRASEPSETGERGFVRVSGRKLPSVLQSGGDGYTDPREGIAGVAPFGGAANDDESIYYRDSQAFLDPGGPDAQSPRLALGSPMRPVSGVVVFKESPARTPVTESAPFADPNASLSPSPPPARDPIGRTMPSQDGSRDSRGSASKFQEQM